MRRTKIIATMGPASESEGVLKDMIEAGADVIRINLSHGSLDSSIEKYRRLRAIEEAVGRPLGILVDLPGPKVRAGTFPEGGTPLEEGARVLGPLGRLVLEPAPERAEERLSRAGLRVIARQDRTMVAGRIP